MSATWYCNKGLSASLTCKSCQWSNLWAILLWMFQGEKKNSECTKPAGWKKMQILYSIAFDESDTIGYFIAFSVQLRTLCVRPGTQTWQMQWCRNYICETTKDSRAQIPLKRNANIPGTEQQSKIPKCTKERYHKSGDKQKETIAAF